MCPRPSSLCFLDLVIPLFRTSRTPAPRAAWSKIGAIDLTTSASTTSSLLGGKAPSIAYSPEWNALSQHTKEVEQLHLKDLKKGTPCPNYGKLEKDAFDEIGDGMIPMEPIMRVAQKAGVKHCHIEQDHSPSPLQSIRKSLNHLNS